MSASDPGPPQGLGTSSRLATVITTLAVLGVVAFAVLFALFSLKWPLHHDLPVLMFNGFLMHDLGRVPYRDFFEVNTPGTMVLYGGLHLITQGNELFLRIIDLVLLACFSAVTIFAMRDHGWRTGALAAACFAIVYLGTGHAMSLQREYICVLFLAISTLLAFRATPNSPVIGSLFIMGLLAGVSVCIKPPMALMWAPIGLLVLFVRLSEKPLRLAAVITECLRVGLPFAIGFVAPIGAIILYLAQIGGLDGYREILTEYYPYYTQLRGDGGVWLVKGWSLYVQRFFAAPLALFSDFSFVILSFLGVLLAWNFRARPQFLQLIVICGFVVMGVGYAMTSGKYWPYHSFPLYFGLALLAGLTVSKRLPVPQSGSLWNASILAFAVAVCLPFTMLMQEFRQWASDAPIVVKEGRVDLVEKYLAANTDEDESVMVFDTASGGIHALYRLRRPLHGPFIYTFHVFHHIDSPIVQRIRKRMLAQFENGEPDVVVWFDFAWGHAQNFEELSDILENDYEIRLQENAVTIYHRKP